MLDEWRKLTSCQKAGVIIGFPILLAAEIAMLGVGLWVAYAFVMIITGNSPK
jgi:hypothetical protein